MSHRQEVARTFLSTPLVVVFSGHARHRSFSEKALYVFSGHAAQLLFSSGLPNPEKQWQSEYRTSRSVVPLKGPHSRQVIDWLS